MNEAQSRMARAVLKIGVRDLAKIAKVSTDTIVRLERGEDLKERTVDAVRAALEGSKVLTMYGDYIAVTVPHADLEKKVASWKRRHGISGVERIA
jgi:DNA-binding XRE family transcriptional regulator